MESELVFLEMQEGFEFTQLTVVVVSFSITENATGRRNSSFLRIIEIPMYLSSCTKV